MQDWYLTTVEMIDMRSFSSLWYWIALAALWSGCMHRVIGVPYDMVLRARRQGGEAEADLHDVLRVNVNHILHVVETSGIVLTAIGCCTLSMLAVLGFVYRLELAQAVFLLAFPMSLVFWMTARSARAIREADGAGLYEKMARLRFMIQILAMVSVAGTAVWGMSQILPSGI